MLRNWVTQFGLDAGEKAGKEKISNEDRNKFIHQVGTYLGWNPPTHVNWSVEVIKEPNDNYIAVFARYLTPDEINRLLRTNYAKPKSEQLGVNYMKEKIDAQTNTCGPTCGCHAPTPEPAVEESSALEEPSDTTIDFQ